MTNPDPVVMPPSAAPGSGLRDRRGLLYTPAVGPRLRGVLVFVFAGVALLGATGAYLLAIHSLEWARNQVYANAFTLWMLVVHVAAGVLVLGPFVVFGLVHWTTAHRRPNRRAVRLGMGVLLTGLAAGLTGLALVQLVDRFQLPGDSPARTVCWWLHVITPVAAVVLYVLHRRAGPPIHWQWGKVWAAVVALFVAGMAVLHAQDPRRWFAEGPREGEAYFEPARTRTAGGTFIPADTLMMDQYCLKCHADVYDGWFHSAHHFSSFNNPAYLFSVRETRRVALQRDGNPRASRWCAGCHDPVPFLSGRFDDPAFDDVNDPTAHAGITCTVCHAMTHVNSTAGNGAYTIEEPEHYPFAKSRQPALQWLNNQLVKAKPDLHRKTFLKPFHRTAEFCSTCHKVSIPMAVNDYKEFLRGQNHYDTYLLSGVSGHGARSFYYPDRPKTNCAACHMPLMPSGDFGARDFDGSGQRKIHRHLFPAANTGLPALLLHEPRYQQHEDGFRKAIAAHSAFLRGTEAEGKPKLRIDLFGLRENGSVHGALHAPLRPNLPRLRPGKSYAVEVVLRTLNLGHPFTQGTADSNEVWVELTAHSGSRLLGQSGDLKGAEEDTGCVDGHAHFVNVLMLDREGQRINRRNPQDIFTPLYDHQIPPGAAQVVHYRLDLPDEPLIEPVRFRARLRYRKFDFEYLALVYGSPAKVPKLPIVEVCTDEVLLPIEGGPDVPSQQSPIAPAWQRWNDYGIGLYLEGGAGKKRGELTEARAAFERLVAEDHAGHAHAYLNLARVWKDSGQPQRAAEYLNRAIQADPPAPWATTTWLSGEINLLHGRVDEAIAAFERLLDPRQQPAGFDFTQDYVVIDALGQALFVRAQQEKDDRAARDGFLRRAVAQFERTLQLDGEDLVAHYKLHQCYRLLGEAVTLPMADAADEGELESLAKTLADRKEGSNLAAAARLRLGVERLDARPAQRDRPKLPVLRALLGSCRTAFREEGDPGRRAAAAQVLAQVHLALHAVYQPDNDARGRAVAAHRRDHPANDLAAQAVVTYPLHP